MSTAKDGGVAQIGVVSDARMRQAITHGLFMAIDARPAQNTNHAETVVNNLRGVGKKGDFRLKKCSGDDQMAIAVKATFIGFT
jgi:hypothetical protein